MQQVSPSQFNDWLKEAATVGQPLILDVRETWECQLASIAPDACEVLIMPMQTIPARLMELDKTSVLLKVVNLPTLISFCL